MLKRLLSKLTGNRQQIEHHLKISTRLRKTDLAFRYRWLMIRSFGHWYPGLNNWLKKTI